MFDEYLAVYKLPKTELFAMDVMIFAYIGPETTIPLLSVIASVIGALLMCGRTTFKYLIRKAKRLIGFGHTAESLEGGDSEFKSTAG